MSFVSRAEGETFLSRSSSTRFSVSLFACRSGFQEATGADTSDELRNKASVRVCVCLQIPFRASFFPSDKTLVPLNLCSRDAEPDRFPEQPQPGRPAAPASAAVPPGPVVLSPGYWRKSSPPPRPADSSETHVTTFARRSFSSRDSLDHASLPFCVCSFSTWPSAPSETPTPTASCGFY